MQIALDPATGELTGDTAAEQAERCLANLDAVAVAAGARLSDAVRVTVYMADLGEFAAVNDVYAQAFEGSALPARAAVGVTALPRGSLVAIEAVVALGG